jgi:cytochrome c biogenesis protein CcmG/thiol:disulfide interchange protein DsbE
MRRRYVAGVAALVALGGVFAFGLSKQGDVGKVDTAHVVVPPEGFTTFAAAPITGTAFDGDPFSLARLRGKPVFVNFWGSWCVPCKREAPDLRAFSESLGARASFVGVAVDSPQGEARAFARKAGWRYPIVSKRCCDLSDRYGIVGMPTTVVIDRRGRVVDRLLGPQTTARLRAELRALGA